MKKETLSKTKKFKIELSLEDLDAILAYKIDANECFSLLRTLYLLNKLGVSFSHIARGKEIYEELLKKTLDYNKK